jgi:hypothetical protein
VCAIAPRLVVGDGAGGAGSWATRKSSGKKSGNSRSKAMEDEPEPGGHDDEQHDAMSAVTAAVAELTDLIVAEVRPPGTYVEFVVAIVASRRDGHDRHVKFLAWLRPGRCGRGTDTNGASARS